MKYKVLTLFPDMIRSVMETGIIGRALKEGALELETFYIRDYADNKRAQVDDYPYGGGAGQVIQAEPVFRAYTAALGETNGKKPRCIYLSPQGRRFDQRLARELASEDELMFLCGHYEGIDERVLEEIVTDYISAGDYILTGGELPALTIMDAVSRLLPGVLGNDSSPDIETFYRDLLEYPQYSRPEVWHDKAVPYVLLSGNHSNIEEWRLERSIERTKANRPDLFEIYEKKENLLERLKHAKIQNIPAIEALKFDDTDILYEGSSYYLIFDRETKIMYAGSFTKHNPIIDGYDSEMIKKIVSERLKEVISVILLNAPDPLFEGNLQEKILIVFTEKTPLSTARVREYGEFGAYLKKQVSEALSAGRIFCEFMDPSEMGRINDALSIGFYSSRCLVAKLVD